MAAAGSLVAKMDGNTIQQRIYAGRGKAALRIGLPCRVFRPKSAALPLANLLTTLYAAFNAGDSTYLKPNKYGNPIWFADLDGRYTRPGDYLVRVSDGGIWFIAAQEQLVPIVAVECNRSVKITRAADNQACGVGEYSSLASDVDYLGTDDTRWPASILLGGRALSANGLPADVKQSGWRILLPPSVPVTIGAGDIAIDDLDRRYAIESAEVTDMGWRLTVNEVHA